MALPDFTIQEPATYKANIDAAIDDHETKLASTVNKITAETNHHRVGNMQIYDGTYNAANPFDAHGNITSNTLESVGRTGSGATNIWTMLDLVPTTARALIININCTVNTSGAFSTNVRCQFSLSAWSGTRITPYLIGFNDSNNSGSVSSINQVIVPFDGDEFEGTWLETGSGTPNNIDWSYGGFISD